MKFNSKTIAKIITVLMIVFAALMAFNMVFAATAGEIPNPDFSASKDINNIAVKIIGIVQVICLAAAVILLVMLGVKYMTAAPEGKADIKKMSVIYVIGAALVLAASGILQIVKKTATTLAPAGGSH